MVKINFDFELIGRDKKRIEEISVRSKEKYERRLEEMERSIA